MAEPTKNTFDFGTGSIDKDQWLRDIDAELDEFISRYAGAVNKHRAALIRQAFSDLRGRIANGDMLNRTADGNYQFGSALNREDKHMQEAYQRALGFMGQLARRQLTPPTPAAEPEKKKIGSLEERYIRSLNPSGKLNTKAYWDNQTDDLRRESLTSFLNKELQEAGNYDDFEGFGTSDEYKKRLNTVLGLLNSKTANDYSLQQLGFTQNWLTKPKDEEETDEKAKTALEQVQADIAAAQEAQQVAQGRLYLSYNANRGTTNFDLTIPAYDFNKALLNYLNGALSDLQLREASYFNPSFNPSEARAEQARKYVAQQQQNLNNYFANFATSWRPNYESGQANRDIMQNYLSRLFATYNKGTNQDGTPITDYAYDWKKYFTLIGDNQFLINGSLDRNTGRYAYYVPGQGIRESNILDTSNPYIAQLLGYTIPSLKEGGKIEFLQQGGGFDYAAWEQANTPKPKPSLVVAKKTEAEPNEGMDTGDWVTIIGTTAADIGSMLSANAVGYGTVASAGLGLTSTLGNSANELRHGRIGSGLANLGIGLTTDLIGLVPGVGAGAKGWKIGRTLTRFARPILAAMAANNYKEAGLVMNKGLKNGWGSLSAEDWALLGTTLTSMFTRGKSAHTRQKNVEFTNRAVRKSSPTDDKGNITKYIINEKGLIEARKELLGEKRFGFNTSGEKYTQKLWQSIPSNGEVTAPYYARPFEWPSFSFGKKSKQAQLDAFEQQWGKRNQPNVPEKNYSAFEADLAAAASPLDIRGPRQPYPTGKPQQPRVETPAATSKPQNNGGKKGKKKHKKHEIGGILKALRNGGILKALAGLQFPDYNPNGNFNSEYYLNWVNLNWGNPENLQSVLKGYKEGKADFRSKNGLPVKGGDQLRYENANGDQDFMSAYQEQLNYYNKNEGASIFGDVRAYYNALKTKNPNLTIEDFITLYNSNVDKLRELAPKKLTGVANEDKTWGDYNTLFNEMYGSYSPFSEGLKDTLGESTWRRIPNTFNGINDRENLRHGLLIDSDPKSKVIIDNTGHLVQPDLDASNNNEVKEKDPLKDGKGKSGDEATDKETGRETEFETKFKNPWDPTLGIIGLKTLQGILGNKDIYGNLIKEMPLAPLRDPIDRKLAIVGWQERIQHGQNQLADLRRVQQMLRGSDQQTNFATALETERVGRDIMDKAFMEDSGRQFETAGKSWNLDNEDYLYNIKARDDNEKSIKDRARAIAQIRAAWRSGDQNIKMGAIADTGNWLMKKFQREQDMIDKAKAIALGTPEEWAQSQFTQRLGNLANKKASDMTEAEKEKVKEIKAQVLKEMRSKFAGKYYDTFHNPWFGGGSSEVLLSKDGGSLEKEKLRLRGKDNDRFASMIKDLRKTHRRRR